MTKWRVRNNMINSQFIYTLVTQSFMCSRVRPWPVTGHRGRKTLRRMAMAEPEVAARTGPSPLTTSVPRARTGRSDGGLFLLLLLLQFRQSRIALGRRLTRIRRDGTTWRRRIPPLHARQIRRDTSTAIDAAAAWTNVDLATATWRDWRTYMINMSVIIILRMNSVP